MGQGQILICQWKGRMRINFQMLSIRIFDLEKDDQWRWRFAWKLAHESTWWTFIRAQKRCFYVRPFVRGTLRDRGTYGSCARPFCLLGNLRSAPFERCSIWLHDRSNIFNTLPNDVNCITAGEIEVVSRKTDAAIVCVDKRESTLDGKRLRVLVDVVGLARLVRVGVEKVVVVPVVEVKDCEAATNEHLVWPTTFANTRYRLM